MNEDHAQLPPEMVEWLRGIFFTLFGGPAKLDCWLTEVADRMADPAQAAPIPLSLALPAEAAAVMHRPREVVDLLLSHLEKVCVWSYTIRRPTFSRWVEVIDDATGHLVELAPVNEVDALVAKYGPAVVMRSG